ncbi:MAG: hypothetical protein ACFE0J_06610 [Elainellaceae cyanobacterium]
MVSTRELNAMPPKFTEIEQFHIPGYPADPQRAILITIEAWDWNCPQHIPHKYSEQEVLSVVEPLRARIVELEAQLEQQKYDS